MLARAQRRRDLEADEARTDHHDAARRLARSMMARLSASERKVWTCGRSAPGNRQAHGLRAGRQQQPVVGDLAAVGQRDLARARIDGGDVGLEPQVDAVLGVEVVAAQRHPFLGRVAGEIVLGEVGPVDRRGVVVAQHDDAALVLLAPQHLGRREAGSAAAHDHDPVRRRRPPAWRAGLASVCALLRDEDLAVALLDRPAVDRAERRRAQRLAGAQAEAGVMPGAAHRVADQQPFGERAVIVAAVRADGEDLAAAARQQHLLVADMADQHAAVGELG